MLVSRVRHLPFPGYHHLAPGHESCRPAQNLLADQSPLDDAACLASLGHQGSSPLKCHVAEEHAENTRASGASRGHIRGEPCACGKEESCTLCFLRPSARVAPSLSLLLQPHPHGGAMTTPLSHIDALSWRRMTYWRFVAIHQREMMTLARGGNLACPPGLPDARVKPIWPLTQ